MNIYMYKMISISINFLSFDCVFFSLSLFWQMLSWWMSLFFSNPLFYFCLHSDEMVVTLVEVMMAVRVIVAVVKLIIVLVETILMLECKSPKNRNVFLASLIICLLVDYYMNFFSVFVQYGFVNHRSLHDRFLCIIIVVVIVSGSLI